ncbi:MAG TPA: rhodanese-like domain-containing protein [Nocardioidaceae bacterium]|nr:rhodanese-like domain-containing protein [Nocardioidaceae bacterium]
MSIQVPTVEVDGVPAPLPPHVHVLDVREQHEWDAGHIEGAQHIPLGDLGARVDEVPADRKVLCVCHIGGRSAQATVFLNRQGRDVVNLAGGMDAWSGSGRPIVGD